MGQIEIGAALREAIAVVMKLGGPPLLAALVVGLAVSLLQAATQVHEQTVAFVPKVVAVIATLMLLGPYMVGTLDGFARLLLDQLVAVGAQ
jgi:flagellar biosynthetic protein FliQ